jgi:hypothetical protein
MTPSRSHRFQDLTGRTFIRWTVIKLSHFHNGHTYWKCRCSCGELKTIQALSLRNGKSTSCGCLKREKASVQSFKHGLSNHPLYSTWLAMKSRCEKPDDQAYPRYGERGISVCARWQSLANFIADVGPRPSPEYTLERKNNNRGYKPSNCIWATMKDQSNNRKGNLAIKYKGQTKTVGQWAREYGIGNSVLWNRIYLCHWSIEKALLTPVRQ